ncbi:TMEM175 family protein [Streptomyces sp. NBC_00448]|uniref:TMEM175 family protein n=1 Tax=Streptomyces sp. NBC_00448 TaxID=2903652 RepID=UPI002E1D75F4
MAQDRHSLGRLTALTDGVFAIALTVLVLQIPVPRLADSGSARQMRTALSRLEGQFLSYAATFVIIAAFWQQHRRLFHLSAWHDEWVGRLNSLFLLLIAFLPFPSALVGRYGSNAAAVVFFNLAVLAVAAVFVLLWLRLRHVGHFTDYLPIAYGRWVLARTLAVSAALAASAALAPFDTDAATYVWIGIVPLMLAVNLRYRKAIASANAAEDEGDSEG